MNYYEKFSREDLIKHLTQCEVSLGEAHAEAIRLRTEKVEQREKFLQRIMKLEEQQTELMSRMLELIQETRENI